ncbi:EthD domain-containing protein [Halieaceae bacterium]|jgi:hypothetical protein|nr:EthD domain-containing protein [Halieaceae bacterium]
MEKIIYLVKAQDGLAGDGFRDLLKAEVSPKLLANGNVQKLRISVEDSDVARAAGLKHDTLLPTADAVVSVFVNTANFQSELVNILEPYTSRIEGYLVSESEVMVPPGKEGVRTVGTVQVCCLSKLDTLSQEEFLSIWRDSHGPIACGIQSTFGYRQNLVIRKLTAQAQDHSAIVEEHFPADAMDSPHVFFDAVGDDAKLQKHVEEMTASCDRFIDNNRINVVHMSEYTIKA